MHDYVIVGAGSAGCVLAARLSEDPDVSVALLEAGPADAGQHPHPARRTALSHSAVDWDYSTGCEPHCDGRRIYLPRGRTLGGSARSNAMVYIRGNRADYDGGRRRLRPAGASRTCCRTSSAPRTTSAARSELHGAGGPLAVSRGPLAQPDDRRVRRGRRRRPGSRATTTSTAPTQDGVGHYQLTQRDGRRCSAAVAYLHPAIERPNLTSRTHRCRVDAGRLRGHARGRRRGERGGEARAVRAEREVILCGGAYNSPQLLMLSGIGPADAPRVAPDRAASSTCRSARTSRTT